MWKSASTTLRDARIKARLSQRAVADCLGYDSAQFVSNWERGISRPPDSRLRELASLFSVPISRIVEAISTDMIADTARWRSQFMTGRK